MARVCRVARAHRMRRDEVVDDGPKPRTPEESNLHRTCPLGEYGDRLGRTLCVHGRSAAGAASRCRGMRVHARADAPRGASRGGLMPLKSAAISTEPSAQRWTHERQRWRQIKGGARGVPGDGRAGGQRTPPVPTVTHRSVVGWPARERSSSSAAAGMAAIGIAPAVPVGGGRGVWRCNRNTVASSAAAAAAPGTTGVTTGLRR